MMITQKASVTSKARRWK